MRAQSGYNSRDGVMTKRERRIGFKSIKTIEEFNDEYPDERTAEDEDIS